MSSELLRAGEAGTRPEGSAPDPMMCHLPVNTNNRDLIEAVEMMLSTRCGDSLLPPV